MKKKKQNQPKATPTETRFVEDLLTKFQMEIQDYADIRNTLEAMAGRVNQISLSQPKPEPVKDVDTIVSKLDDKVITFARLNESMREILAQLSNSI